MKTSRLVLATLAVLASFEGSAAPDAPSAAGAAGGQALEEILVTARKTTENIQKIPVSVTALPATEIEDRDITSIEDLSALVPNLLVRESSSGYVSSVACMRGLCRTNTAISEDPMVGTYIDGVYVSKAIGSQFEANDLERIEVLRGPQGTLYGKNTLAGAISLVTKKPTGEFGGDFGLNAGNYNKRDIRAALDFPITSELAARVSLLSNQHDGYTSNDLGEDLWAEDQKSGRIAIRWRPGDDWVVDYAYDKLKHRDVPGGSQVAYVSAPRFDSDGHLLDGLFDLLYSAVGEDLTAYQTSERQDRISARGPNKKNLDLDAHTLTIRWDLGSAGVLDDLSLKSITGYRDQSTSFAFNLTPFIFESIGGATGLKTFSEEVQFQFSTMNNAIKGLVGLYYFSEKGHEYEAINYDQLWEQARKFESTTDSAAIFGDLRYAITSKIELSAGFRYTQEDRSADSFFTFYTDTPHTTPGVLHDPRIHQYGSLVALDTRAQTYFGVPLPGYGLPAYDTDISFSNVSPRASVSYKMADDVMVFASYSRGFKSGGFNGLSSSPVSWTPYKDVVVDSYETGIKSRFWEDRALLNLSAFYEDVSDMQVQVSRINPLTNTYESVVENAAAATITGLEMEAMVAPVEGLQLSATLGYQHPKYDQYMAVDPNTGAIVDVSNKRVFEFTPEFTYSLTATYETPFRDIGIWSIRADLTGMSSHDFQSVHDPRIDQAAYSVFDVQIALKEVRVGSGTLALTAWGKNLTDESYAVSGFNFPDPYGFGQLGYGPPRTYGLEAAYSF